MITAYSQDRTGRITKRIVTGERHKRAPRGDTRPARHFSETLLKSYYALECEQGSRFRSSFTKDTTKRVHETRLALFDQTGRER